MNGLITSIFGNQRHCDHLLGVEWGSKKSTIESDIIKTLVTVLNNTLGASIIPKKIY